MHSIYIGLAVCAAWVVPGTYCQALPPGDFRPTASEITASEKPVHYSSVLALAESKHPGQASITTYQFGRITLHTDLPPQEAQATLGLMKRTLRFSERYWQQRVQGSLKCYVAANATNWPDRVFPHPLARVWIECIGGATICEPVPANCGEDLQVTMYASTQPGAVAHELIHAYCCQTFGQTGPDWYKEGFASMVGFGCQSVQGVQCPPAVLVTLRQGPAQTVSQLFQHQPVADATSQSLSSLVKSRDLTKEQIPISRWSEEDIKNLASMRQFYDWSWALCYMLKHDPNYRKQFRELGTVYMEGRQPDYQQVFGAIHQQLTFDYKLFLQHVDLGYRVDLCSWEWGEPFQELSANNTQSQFIKAARGYQATRVQVVNGQSYQYSAEGLWCTAENASKIDADGGVDGLGQLEGVILKDYQLSEPIPLGTKGRFVAPHSGRLYVRCHDAWNQLADNRGTLKVAITCDRKTTREVSP